MVKASVCCFFMIVATVFAAELAVNQKSSMKINKHRSLPFQCMMAMKSAKNCCKVPKVFSEATMTECGMSPPPSGGEGNGQLFGGPGGLNKGNMTCALISEQLLTTAGEVDTAALRTKFIAAAAAATPADSEWPSAFDTALTDCQAKASSNAAYASADQNQKNMMSMMCMRKTLLMNCPTASKNTTVTTCTNTLASLGKCNTFMIPPSFPPGGMGANFEGFRKMMQGKFPTQIAG